MGPFKCQVHIHKKNRVLIQATIGKSDSGDDGTTPALTDGVEENTKVVTGRIRSSGNSRPCNQCQQHSGKNGPQKT